jgi:hypothetical protein
MARMYPSTIADDHGSHAERRIFAKLRDQTPPGWLVVHSVGLASHSTKPWAEIDFVVVGEDGVFCLEVKGGEIEHREGSWYTNQKRLKESPFAQAGGASSALYKYLADRVPAVRRSFVGYGVVFPDTTFDRGMPSAEPELIYDERDLGRPISDYFARVADYWRQRLAGQHAGHVPGTLNPAERSAIIRELAPDFDLVPSLRARIFEVDEELVRLTNRQKELLDGLVDEPRVVVKGGAGTGKSLLACEEALRLSRTGQRTMFVCFGSRLANHVRPALAPAGVEVVHLHGLMSDLIERAGFRDQLPAVDERDLFDIYYPQVAIDALVELERFGSIDALVLDEGQDLLKTTYVQFFDALLAGETAGGIWRFFYDPNQDLFLGAPPRELERIEALGVSYRLTKNCRNTREIALATSFVSGVKLAETLVVAGPEVSEEWGADTKQQEKAACRILRAWLDGGLRPDQITILSSRRLERSLIGSIDERKLPRTVVDISHTHALDDGRFRFSTIAGFKGLESDAVLLVDIDDVAKPDQLALLYVGASRARSVLGLVLDERCRETYGERVSEIVSRLVGERASASATR